MIKPNFLGIGAMKAGTTWAADSLAAHPEILMAHGKELHYFSMNYERGPEWYLKHFSKAKRQKAIGEYYVTYMGGPESIAQRIYDFNPGMRLIVSVREPLERAFSQYRWVKQMGADLPSFREALKLRPELVGNSLYAANLAPYWQLFPAEQFFYIKESDVRERPGIVCRNLYNYLGVDSNYVPKEKDRVIGETIQPKSRFLEDLRIRIHHTAMRYGAGALITLYRRLGLSRAYRQLNNDKSRIEILTERDRRDFESLFDEDLAKFQSHTGICIR